MSAPSCDETAGLYLSNSGDGCVMHTYVGLSDTWEPVALFLIVAVLVCLGALVVGQFRRG